MLQSQPIEDRPRSGTALEHRRDHVAPALDRRDLLRDEARRHLVRQHPLQDLEFGQLARRSVEQLGFLKDAHVVPDRVPAHAQLPGDDARAFTLPVQADQVLETVHVGPGAQGVLRGLG